MSEPTSRKESLLKRFGEPVIEGLIRLCGVSAIIFVFAILAFILGVTLVDEKGHLDLGFFAGQMTAENAKTKDNFAVGEFLFDTHWVPTSKADVRYGVAASILGTLAITALAMVMAVPFGLGGAIYVSEFCGKRTREILKVVIELLAAVPSIVWGFIGLGILNPLIQQVFQVPIGLNMFNGAILLALMSVPIIVSIGEDALKAVPDSFREASLGLGANRWQTIYRVLLPAAKNGLLAAVLLGVARGVGETMAVLMATGHSVRIPWDMFSPMRTLTATIAAELGETAQGTHHYRVLFLIGVLLFIITFIVNMTADLVVKGIRRQK